MRPANSIQICKSYGSNYRRAIYHHTRYHNVHLMSNDDQRLRLGLSSSHGVLLPLSKIHIFDNGNGVYPLIIDPIKQKKAAIIGMFVLRPLEHPCDGSIYDIDDWIYNVSTINGGGIISQGNQVDSFRLALQYGLSDAVIMSSHVVSTEGVTTRETSPGYLWQPHFPLTWPHMANIPPPNTPAHLLYMISDQRNQWQELNYLSSRKRPAQIVYTRSGARHPTARHDFLDAYIFSDQQALEVYILTSTHGAQAITERVMTMDRFRHLRHRLQQMLIVHSPADNPSLVDLATIPQRLYDQFDMRIVNHDGGKVVFDEFMRYGAVNQVNITFCRKNSLRSFLPPEIKHQANGFQYFFEPNVLIESDIKKHSSSIPLHHWLSTHHCGTSDSLNSCNSSRRGVYSSWEPLALITDSEENVAIVSFYIHS